MANVVFGGFHAAGNIYTKSVDIGDSKLITGLPGSPQQIFVLAYQPSTTAAATDLLAAENAALKAELKKERGKVEFLLKRVRVLENLTAGTMKPRPIEDLSQRLRSLSGGDVIWRQAEAQRSQEHRDGVERGKMSKIKYHRLRRKIDQKTLADALGTKQANISRLERPGYRPRIGTLEKLAKALAVSMADLLPGKA
jgi:DNA-binding Xre family transcriptional regulator